MASTKLTKWRIASGLVIGLILATLAGFTVPTRAVQVQNDELANISQNCSSIKQSLNRLQHADSRTRAYLGAAYETVANTFITPLNLRLVRNNRPDPELLEIQASFTEAQSKFRSTYTEYMRELENLIAVNCTTHPEEFYEHLETTRERRAALKDTTVTLTSLIRRQLEATRRLQEELR